MYLLVFIHAISASNQKSLDVRGYTLHDVDHIQQRFNWDCGIACVMMLLSPQQREEFEANFNNICAEEGFHQSTWTVDLCYLLKRLYKYSGVQGFPYGKDIEPLCLASGHLFKLNIVEYA